MKIVFVCTCNACRSAAAESVLKKMIEEHGITDVEVASCGTKVYGFLRRDMMMCSTASEKGYTMGGSAMQATDELLGAADHIIVMTERHRNDVTRLLEYGKWDRISSFNDFCFGEAKDLPDPHLEPESVYRSCFDTIERGCREIIMKLHGNKND